MDPSIPGLPSAALPGPAPATAEMATGPVASIPPSGIPAAAGIFAALLAGRLGEPATAADNAQPSVADKSPAGAILPAALRTGQVDQAMACAASTRSPVAAPGRRDDALPDEPRVPEPVGTVMPAAELDSSRSTQPAASTSKPDAKRKDTVSAPLPAPADPAVRILMSMLMTPMQAAPHAAPVAPSAQPAADAMAEFARKAPSLPADAAASAPSSGEKTDFRHSRVAAAPIGDLPAATPGAVPDTTPLAAPGATPEAPPAAAPGAPAAPPHAPVPGLPVVYAVAELPQQSPAAAPDAPILHMSVASRVGTQAWREEFASGVHMLATQRVSSAELRVQPEELGPVQVSIRIEAGEASIACAAHHADARHALEAALPRLRELLEASGIAVGSASVGTQHPGDRGAGAQSEGQSRAQGASSAPPEPAPASATRVTVRSDRLVDLYA